tara:strand:+ start:468 stop:641 length:174 start_codon:yes stop_codon:yes gene_type:complete
MKIHNYIELLMTQAKTDPMTRGWSMQELIKQVVYVYGKDSKPIAKQYIMNKCGYRDE